MGRRGGKKNDFGALGLVFILGVPVFLLMVHPLLFFLAFVPLVAIGIVMIVRWFKK